MLVNEKRRVAWSLAVGLLLAITTEAAVRVLEWHATLRLKASVVDCEKPDPKDPVGKGHWEPICEPKDLREMTIKRPNGSEISETDDELIATGGVTAQIIRNDQAVTRYRDDEWFFGGILLALSCLPLIWFFLLDRIREISGAVSGRDRNL